jgi:CPA2 family monovalent cation:H+ antiporter-2
MLSNPLLRDLSIILVLSGICGWIFKRFLNMPLLLGYILGGFILNTPFDFIPKLSNLKLIHYMAEIGILIIMFEMGLHFGYRRVKNLGMAPIFVGTCQVLLMWTVGTQVSSYFNLNQMTSIFLGAVIATSSTTVILKVLEDFKLRTARFAEALIATLLIEDCLTIFILIYLKTTKHTQSVPILYLIAFFLFSVLFVWLIGTISLPRFLKSIFQFGKDELLLILSIALVLSSALAAEMWDFSQALGAFVMGSILSESHENKKIEQLTAPLKHIFGCLFFVSVGLYFDPGVFKTSSWLILGLILTVILGKIIFNLTLNILVGRTLQDSLRIAGSMPQNGELSFVVAQTGVMLGVLNARLFSVVVVGATVTMILTPFIMRLNLYIANRIETILPAKVIGFFNYYSKLILEFNIATALLPTSSSKVMSKLRFIFERLQEYLKKNFMKITSSNLTATLDRLAPWDEYLSQINVYSGSYAAGKSLLRLKLREKITVSVVAIERGETTLISPDLHEILIFHLKTRKRCQPWKIAGLQPSFSAKIILLWAKT